MDSSVRTVTRQSWGTRLRGSFKGILFGLVCLAAAVAFLFWNEGRAVKRYRALQEGGGVVTSIDPATTQSANEGKLVHFSGTARTEKFLTDRDFNLSVLALRLQRQVEMYQWREVSKSTTEKKVGGSAETVTSYSYEKAWLSEAVDSARFKVPEGHRNPGYFAYPERNASAPEVRVGAFRLPPNLVNSINNWEPVSIRLEQLPRELRWRSHLYEGGIFIGRNPSAPAVGDLRVKFRSVPPTQVSIVARQVGDSVEPYTAANGEKIQLLRLGSVSAEAMFEGAQSSNRTTTWIFRFIGFLGVFFGFARIFKPLSVMGDVIPTLGNALESGSRMLSFLLAVGLSSVTIAVAWLYYRPFVAFLVLALAALSVFGIVRLFKKSAKAPAQPPAPPPSPAH